MSRYIKIMFKSILGSIGLGTSSGATQQGIGSAPSQQLQQLQNQASVLQNQILQQQAAMSSNQIFIPAGANIQPSQLPGALNIIQYQGSYPKYTTMVPQDGKEYVMRVDGQWVTVDSIIEERRKVLIKDLLKEE